MPWLGSWQVRCADSCCPVYTIRCCSVNVFLLSPWCMSGRPSWLVLCKVADSLCHVVSCAAAKDPNWRTSPVLVSTLKMVGGCRGEDDERRLQQLQQYAEELGISGDHQYGGHCTLLQPYVKLSPADVAPSMSAELASKHRSVY